MHTLNFVRVARKAKDNAILIKLNFFILFTSKRRKRDKKIHGILLRHSDTPKIESVLSKYNAKAETQTIERYKRIIYKTLLILNLISKSREINISNQP